MINIKSLWDKGGGVGDNRTNSEDPMITVPYIGSTLAVASSITRIRVLPNTALARHIS